MQNRPDPSAVSWTRYVICVYPESNPIAVMERKVYRRLPDADAEAHGMIRVIDETDEDYLYPADWFIPADLSDATVSALETARDRADFTSPLQGFVEESAPRKNESMT